MQDIHYTRKKERKKEKIKNKAIFCRKKQTFIIKLSFKETSVQFSILSSFHI